MLPVDYTRLVQDGKSLLCKNLNGNLAAWQHIWIQPAVERVHDDEALSNTVRNAAATSDHFV